MSSSSTHLFLSEPNVWSQWMKFAHRHRVNFGMLIGKFASLRSTHFEQNCLENHLASPLPGMEDIKVKKNLILGSVPTRDNVLPDDSQVLSERQKRQVRIS